MAHQHQAKRPYAGSQPSITSYFPATDNYIHAPTPSSVPALPPNVQSNLLQVGMRVRKSVPEGYKTGSLYSGFSLFSESSSPSTTPTSCQSYEQSESGQQKPKTRPRAGARELTPFCGILKVGGMAQQQWGIYSPPVSPMYEHHDPMSEEEEEEDCPVLSQGSTGSNSTVDIGTPNGNKRRFFEDEEVDGVERVLGARLMAVPRKKKWVGHGNGKGVGQENMGVGVVGEQDFEEAPFLDFGLVGEREVEMGGV